MSNPSSQPSEAKETDKAYWNARAETLKQQLMQRRLQIRSAQPADTSSSQGAPGQVQQREQLTSDGHEPIQTMTTTIAGTQPTPGPSHHLPGDMVTHQEPQLEDSSALNTPDQSSANDSVQIPVSITGNPMEKLSSPAPSKAAGKETNDALMAVNDTKCDKDVLKGANDHASTGVRERPDDGAHSKIQRGDNSNVNKGPHASRSGNQSTTAPKDKPTTQSSAEEGEIRSMTSAPLSKIPVNASTTQPASGKKTAPARVSTVTNIAPTEPHAKRHFTNSLEATPDVKHRGVHAGVTSGAHSSVSRTGGKHEHSRHSLPARPSSSHHDDHTTWDAYKAPPPPAAHHLYAKPNRERRPRAASPVDSRPIEDSDWDVQMFAYRHPELHEWLRLTGWYAPDFRTGELHRLRLQEEIDRESAELKREGELAKARLKAECGEPAKEARHLSDAGHRSLLLSPAPPRCADQDEAADYRMLGRYAVTAGIKRERSDGSDGDADGSLPAKYYRTNRNYRGSRAGYHGPHGSNHRGREDSRYWQNQDRQRNGRLSPPYGLPESMPPRYQFKRRPRQRFPSPVGHPLPRDEFDAERETDRNMSRERPPPRHRPHRSSSSGRGYTSSRFHESK